MKSRLTLLFLFPALLFAEEGITPPDYSFVNEFIRMLSVLGAMIGALLLVAWFMKKMMATRIEQINQTSEIRILESRTIAPKCNIYLLDVRGKQMVVAESQAGVQHLTNLNPEETNEMD